MSLLQCLAETACSLEERRGAARRVYGAVDPGVEVIAQDHHFLGFLAPADHADDAAKRSDPFFVLHVHVERDWPGTDVVLERQSALPFRRRLGTAQLLQDGGSVPGIQRQRGNSRQLLVALRSFHPAAIRLLLPVKREWLALAEPVVNDRAPLDVRVRAPGPFRIDLALDESVFGGVGVDDRARRAAALRLVDLVTAVRIRVRVPHQHDLALEIDAHAVEHLEILGTAAVGVDDLGAHFSRCRVAMEGHLRRVVVSARVLVGRVGILPQVEGLLDRRADRERRRLGKTEQGRKLVETHLVEAVLAKAVAHVLRERVIALGACHVRLFGEEQQVLAIRGGVRCGREDPFRVRCGGQFCGDGEWERAQE